MQLSFHSDYDLFTYPLNRKQVTFSLPSPFTAQSVLIPCFDVIKFIFSEFSYTFHYSNIIILFIWTSSGQPLTSLKQCFSFLKYSYVIGSSSLWISTALFVMFVHHSTLMKVSFMLSVKNLKILILSVGICCFQEAYNIELYSLQFPDLCNGKII